jgi:carbonic anhydrase
VQAALQNRKLGLIDNWLRHVQNILQSHRKMFISKSEQANWDRLCELNVIEQAKHVAETTIVQEAWQRGQELSIHGWVYSISDGVLKDLHVNMDGMDFESIYRDAIASLAA